MLIARRLVLCGVLAAAATAASTAANREAADWAPPRGHLEIRVTDGAVTVEARDVPLSDLLAELAHHAKLELELAGSLDERRTARFDGLRLAVALRRLLPGRSFLLSPGSDGGRGWLRILAPDALAARRSSPQAIPPPPTAARLRAVADAADGDGDLGRLSRSALSDPARAVRLEAVHGLGALGDADALPVLERALGDDAREVRRAALEATVDIGGDRAAWAAGRGLEAEDAELRELTLYALEEIGGPVARVLLEGALADADEAIRDTAAEILETLTPSERAAPTGPRRRRD